MRYSNFQLEQIKLALKNYQQLCDVFFELAMDKEMQVKLEEILYDGGYNGFSFNSGHSNKDNPFLEAQRRIAMAYLLIKNPETFDFLVQNKINLFHGTNANALSLIIKYGLNSFEESNKKGLNVITGEHWSLRFGMRNFVSFSDILGIACDYSTIKPDNSSDLLAFGIVIGISVQDAMKSGLVRVSSDIPEVGVKKGVPIENIKVICVSSDKLEFVKKIVDNDEIRVLPMDDIEERFYYIDEYRRTIIDSDKLEVLKNNLKQPQVKKSFSIMEIKDLTLGRALSNIRKKLEKISLVFHEEREEDYGSRKC